MAIPTPSSSLRIARRRLRDFRERESCLGETLGEVRGVLENGWADWAGNAGGVLGFLGKMSLAPVSVVVTCWMDGGQINKSHEPIKGRTFVKVGVFFFSMETGHNWWWFSWEICGKFGGRLAYLVGWWMVVIFVSQINWCLVQNLWFILYNQFDS